jgi:DNA-binding transcriptional MerR regulator
MALQESFPTRAAATLAGVTPKTIRNWDLRGFIKPSVKTERGRGRMRFYTFRDLIAFRIADDLRARGVEVHKLRRVIEYVQQRKGLAITRSNVHANTILVTDGLHFCEVEGNMPASVFDKLDSGALFVIPFGSIVTRIQAEANAMCAA